MIKVACLNTSYVKICCYYYIMNNIILHVATDTWKWADSTALQFTDWVAGSPTLVSYYSRSERICTRMMIQYTPGYWDDYYCDNNNLLYVCETPKSKRFKSYYIN